MIILGIDASLNCPGFAVISVENGKAECLMTAAVDNKSNSRKRGAGRKSTPQKLVEIAARFHMIMRQYNPDIIVREKGFSHHAGVTQLLFRVVGVLDFIAMANFKKEISEIPPKEIKYEMTGSGAADKEKVEMALLYYIGERPYITNDESDAVAVALTFAIKEGLIESQLVDRKLRRSGPKKANYHGRKVLPHENIHARTVRGIRTKHLARSRKYLPFFPE